MDTGNICGCCEGISKETPQPIFNRPGLKAIAYRTGTYAQFRESLMAALSQYQAFRALSTRDNSDFTVALLDSWAVVSEIISFYQERMANESYLHTATELKSVLELARLVGYKLRPGVAANCYLAFTADSASLVPGQVQITGNTQAKNHLEPVLIPSGTKIQSVPGPKENPQIFETSGPLSAYAELNAIKPKLSRKQTGNLTDSGHILVVEGANNNIQANDMMLIIQNETKVCKKIFRVVSDAVNNTTSIYFSPTDQYHPKLPPRFSLDFAKISWAIQPKQIPNYVNSKYKFTLKYEDLSSIPLSPPPEQTNNKTEIYVFRKKANPFGYNAQRHLDLYKDDGTKNPNPIKYEWPSSLLNRGYIYLESAYDQIEENSYIIVESDQGSLYTPYQISKVSVTPYTQFGLSGKSTKLTLGNLASTDPTWYDPHKNETTIAPLRSMTIHVQAEMLTLAESPLSEVVDGNEIAVFSNTEIEKVLTPEKPVVIFGEEHDSPGSIVNEVRIITRTYPDGDDLVLVLDANLEHKYIRKTMSINANVVQSTHGETVMEILGSGDASQVFQKFELKNAPLTYIGSDTPDGTQSTLVISVNDILWKEVPNFYGRGPYEQIFVTQLDENGKTSVVFGDGKTGARLPTGSENIRAVYRKGIGSTGMLKAAQLSQMPAPVAGIKAVFNPQASHDAGDRELLADARSNATNAIYTLGRIVSLKDYEDFARAFAGIAKASARIVWNGHNELIRITVAGNKGMHIKKESSLITKLQNAISNAAIPGATFEISDYDELFFWVEGNIRINPDYNKLKVRSEIESIMRETFSFENRNFGQSVTKIEITALIQQIPGVVAFSLEKLYKLDDNNQDLNAILPAYKQLGDKLSETPGLLLLDPSPLNFTVLP